jgi:ABC-type uncharacterized transport system auxiliary subunit
MKRTRIPLAPAPALALAVALALTWTLTACGPDKQAATTPAAPGAETAQPSKSGIEDLAAPVTAPLKARDRLLHDMRQQNAKAQQRRGQLDSVIDQDR